jgi:thiol-disulfide isomerase/thioredoxin
MKSIRLFAASLLIASSVFAADIPRKASELAFMLPGQGEKLLSQYRGKVVAIEFILTTCPHCQAAAKVNAQLEREYGARGFQMIDLAINAYDSGGTDQSAPALVQYFAQTYGATNFPVGWVKRDAMLAFMNFSIMDRMVVPQMVLIDRKGFVQEQTPADSGPGWEKVMNEPSIRAKIEQLLAESTGSAHHPVHVASARKN